MNNCIYIFYINRKKEKISLSQKINQFSTQLSKSQTYQEETNDYEQNTGRDTINTNTESYEDNVVAEEEVVVEEEASERWAEKVTPSKIKTPIKVPEINTSLNNTKKSKLSSSKSVTWTESDLESIRNTLPEDWIVCLADSKHGKRPAFGNIKTKKTTWYHPITNKKPTK